MDAIANLIGRVSCPRLREPGPSPDELALMFRCALRAPDHGQLRPWRFVLFRGADRERLGEVFLAAEAGTDPAADAAHQEKLRGNPLRAPLVIACVARVIAPHKVPRIEQVASVAAAVQNLQLAADALGYGAMWRTGPMAAHPEVKRRLGFTAEDEIVAFLYVGTVDGARRTASVPAIEEFVREGLPD